jgi:hypothetical protein
MSAVHGSFGDSLQKGLDVEILRARGALRMDKVFSNRFVFRVFAFTINLA